MVTLEKLAEDIGAAEEGRRAPKVIHFGLSEALRHPVLKGISGVYKVSSTLDGQILFLASSPDVGEDLERHSRGETSAALELLISRDAEHLEVEVLPIANEARDSVYRAALAILRDEYRIQPPLNPEP
jgi:hypothetical protein